jgi:ribose/xylose/arabinose/galactoside ABC-type transport system permease subunit
VNPEKRIRQVYLIAALLAALAGWMLSGHITSVDPVLGQGDVFEVMAACVMGGVSLSGGRGTMVGAFGGVLLLSAVASGLNLVNISPFWTDAIRGLIILIAMLIDAQRVRYSAPAAAKTGLAAPAVPAGR